MIDVYALARAVYANRKGQTGIAPAKGEHQAFARLRRGRSSRGQRSTAPHFRSYVQRLHAS